MVMMHAGAGESSEQPSQAPGRSFQIFFSVLRSSPTPLQFSDPVIQVRRSKVSRNDSTLDV